MRVGIDEDQPITRRSRRTGIARASDLVDRLKDDLRACCPGQFRRRIGRIVVTNNQFGLPFERVKGRHRRLDALERAADELLFVERGDYN